MKEQLRTGILAFITLVSMVLFVTAIYAAFKCTKEEVAVFNTSFWSHLITTINGLLTVNLGVLLGVNIVTTKEFRA